MSNEGIEVLIGAGRLLVEELLYNHALTVLLICVACPTIFAGIQISHSIQPLHSDNSEIRPTRLSYIYSFIATLRMGHRHSIKHFVNRVCLQNTLRQCDYVNDLNGLRRLDTTLAAL